MKEVRNTIKAGSGKRRALPLGVWWTLVLSLVLPVYMAGQRVDPNDDSILQTWTVGNQFVQAQYTLSGNGFFRMISLQRPGGREWSLGPIESPIFIKTESFVLNGSTRWKLNDSHTDAAGRSGQRQVIDLIDTDGRAEVKLNIETHPGQPFIRTYYSYKNLEKRSRQVQEARFVNLVLNTQRRQIRTLFVNQMRRDTPLMFDVIEKNLGQEPDRAVTVNAGSHADQITWLALRDDADNGLVFGWEFNGRSSVQAQLSAAGDELDVWGSPSDMHAVVGAGAEVQLPGGFVGLYEGDWDEAAYRTHRYSDAVLALRAPDNSYPYLMFDTWGYMQNIDEVTLRRVADIAAYIGVEVFIVDLGWARRIGDWEVDLGKFPSGLQAFGDYVRGKGMKFGLHFVPVEAEPEAPVLQQHPDWTASVNDFYFDAKSLCISHTPAQTWLRDSIQAVVDQYHPDWVTQDAENLVKTCNKTTHSHYYENSNWANSTNGIDSFIKFVRGKYPKVHWENNADGGTMSTFQAVKYYAGFASCDACWYTQRRQAVYGMSYVFPPRMITRYMLEQPPTKFLSRSSMFGGPWLLMNRPTEWSQEHIELARQEAQLYKSLRGLIRTGKVYHLLNRPDGYSVDAMESFDDASQKGVIFVYRPESPVFSQVIHPRGLTPSKNYRVTFQESGDVISDSGANLMAKGINVKLPEVNFAEIVYITGY